MSIEFEPFMKIPRLMREIVITEKIDGTNGVVYIVPALALPKDNIEYMKYAISVWEDGAEEFLMFAGSRTRWITSDNDNHKFAAWVEENERELRKLGPGRHFGEWWGGKIQRGYGIPEKRFSLFNVARWKDERPACCHVVPTLYEGPFSMASLMAALSALRRNGSYAAPGFDKPEGVIVWHTAARQLFKVTLENDDEPKSKRGNEQQG